MKCRLDSGLVATALLAAVTLLLTQPCGAGERVEVAGLGVECDLEQGSFALRMKDLGVFLRGPLPALSVGESQPQRPSARHAPEAESVRTDTGGQRLTITYTPEAEGEGGALVYAFEVSGDGRQVTLSAQVGGADGPLRSQLGAEATWGSEGFPCRLEPGDHPGVVQMALGNVSSGLCDSLFDKQTDSAVTFSGGQVNMAAKQGAAGTYGLTVVSVGDRIGPVEACRVEVTPEYYKRVRGIEWYAPIDKSIFKTAPNGWCSWYYYYLAIDEEEMVKNTDWLAENLKPFGLEYVQLDDGFQTGSWTEWNARFPHGGEWLADYIHSKGLKAGLWLTPYSQGDEALVEQHPKWFLRDAEGKVVRTFKGPLTVDASNPEVINEWFAPLCGKLCREWGFDYLKIDGQPRVIGAYRSNRDRFFDAAVGPAEAYRRGLAQMREVIGPEAYLLGCWGIPLEGLGIMNGSRTGGDVGTTWKGFHTALAATTNWYFLHNIAWYCDPDVVEVAEPLTLDQATAWATLLGITGQHLMCTGKTYELPQQRVELLRRLYPLADIRPMDLYRYEAGPRIWDLKIAHGGEQYDVVAVFNWDEQPRTVSVDYAALGLDPGPRYVVYEFWKKRLIGVLPVGFSASLPPTAAGLYAVRPVGDRPVLISTSRHVTQGALDLSDVRWSHQEKALTGTSQVVGGDPYAITVFLPPFPNKWSLERATAKGAEVKTRADGVLAHVTLTSAESRAAQWRLTFASASGREPAVAAAPTDLGGEATTMRDVRLTWTEAEHAIGYHVYRGDERIAFVAEPRYDDGGLQPATEYTYQVASVSWDGSASEPTAPLAVRTQEPPPRPPKPDVHITDFRPRVAEQGWGRLQSDKSVQGKPLSIGGEKFERGLGSHAAGRIVYDLDGTFSRFVALVGVDDETAGRGSIVFRVYLDGEKVFDSGAMRGGEAPMGVDVKLGEAKQLSLVMTDAGDDIHFDHADWVEAGFVR